VRVFGKLGLVILVGAALLSPADQATPTPEPVSRGNDWRVDPVVGGYRVTLKLADRVPLPSALPLLAIDGKPAGVGRAVGRPAHADVSQPGPDAARREDVKLVWSIDTPNTKKARGADAPGTDADWLKAPRCPLLGVDPGAAGTAKLGIDFLSEVDDSRPPVELEAYGYPDPAQATGWMTVNLVKDKVKEPAERFTVKLGEVQEAVLTGPTTVTGTITDDD
jgi:hypothetical protein